MCGDAHIIAKRLGVAQPRPGSKIKGGIMRLVKTLFPEGRTLYPACSPVTQENPVLPFTCEEVAEVARALPRRKAPGPGGVPNEAIRVPECFTSCLNKCLCEGVFPALYKKARLKRLPAL